MKRATRLRIYKEALSDFIEMRKQLDYDQGLCEVLAGLCDVGDIMSVFIEVKKFEPAAFHTYPYWYPRNRQGINRRIFILRKIIKAMEAGK
ncbi:MAG: hypothetical protein UZ04_CHB001001482 [Chlorobi bacterium OLB4]|jgi:hypothetical protein|nr:MAG: hypothetical protein UZ04_CHB001001482 [Chlorobi bacterium OLB4]MBV6399560.1 hypothetical protein [Ignavibacteria bacterium]RIK47815.1 MAG: hypothetical protein DCC60_09585 [Ignavibacteriota bacterium]